MNIGERIRKYRGLNNLMTQKELARKTGITQTNICLYEKGKRLPGIKSLNKLAAVFNVKIEEFFKQEAAQ